MGLYKRGRVWWIEYRDERGERVRQSLKTTDRDVAKMLEARELRAVELRRAGVAAASPAAGRIGMDALIDEFVEHRYGASGSVPRHVQQVRAHLKRMAVACGFESPAQVNAPALRRYFAESLGDLAYGTRRDVRSWCRLLFEYAARVRRPPVISLPDGVNPADLVMPRLTHRAGRIEGRSGTPVHRMALTREQIRTLLFAPMPERSGGAGGVFAHEFEHRRRVYTLILHTGYRREVVERLTREQIRLDAERPHIRVPREWTKAGREIVTELVSPVVVGAIRRALQADAERAPVGAEGRAKGRPFAPVPHARTLRRDAELLGLPVEDADGCPLDIHALRTTFGTQLALAGAELQQVQLLMDHADPKTTVRHYLKVGITPTRAALARMPQFDVGDADDGVVGRIG